MPGKILHTKMISIPSLTLHKFLLTNNSELVPWVLYIYKNKKSECVSPGIYLFFLVGRLKGFGEVIPNGPYEY